MQRILSYTRGHVFDRDENAARNLLNLIADKEVVRGVPPDFKRPGLPHEMGQNAERQALA